MTIATSISSSLPRQLCLAFHFQVVTFCAPMMRCVLAAAVIVSLTSAYTSHDEDECLAVRSPWFLRNVSPNPLILTGGYTRQFLKRNLPPQDEHLPEEYLREDVKLALIARDATPWAKSVPWDST